MPKLADGYNPIGQYEAGSRGNDIATRERVAHLNGLAQTATTKPKIDPTAFAIDYLAAKKAPTPLVTPPRTPTKPMATEVLTPNTSPDAKVRAKPAGGPVRMVMHPPPSRVGSRDITRLAHRSTKLTSS